MPSTDTRAAQEPEERPLARIAREIAEIRGLPTDEPPAPEEREPTDGELDSACMWYRHDFGLMKGFPRTKLRSEAREWLRAWRKVDGDLVDLGDRSAARSEEREKPKFPVRFFPSRASGREARTMEELMQQAGNVGGGWLEDTEGHDWVVQARYVVQRAALQSPAEG